MLKQLKDVKFIGDLSLQDADVLANYARQSNSILEFGTGGSTQIIAQCNPGINISIETDPEWIAVTQRRLTQLDATPVEFYSYADLAIATQNKTFDLIFVDGVDYLRREFAINMWPLLNINGVMIFHDTRRFNDFQNAAWVAQLFFNEISSIDVNAIASNGKSSNMTILHKKVNEPYENWNHTEDKPLWAYAAESNSEDLPLWEHVTE